MARDGQPGGGRQRARAGADHRNPCHVRDFIRRRQGLVPECPRPRGVTVRAQAVVGPGAQV
ncbi:hypothetical protein GCM10018789_01560 [Streptomyces werraensis]|nr:hypothetical protein GCM10018789_01560 [Streptomyces werraensis]